MWSRSDYVRKEYILENSTENTVKLEFYQGSEPSFGFSSITLGSSERIVGNEFEFSKPISDDPEYNGPRLAFSADSVVVLFNNQKSKIDFYNVIEEEGIIYSDPKSRNIFRHGNYVKIGNEQFLYRITEEDYQNASPCNGECD